VTTCPSDISAHSTGLYDVLSKKTEILACGLDSEKKNSLCVERDVRNLHPVTNLPL
jgi:hypothetical protein